MVRCLTEVYLHDEIILMHFLYSCLSLIGGGTHSSPYSLREQIVLHERECLNENMLDIVNNLPSTIGKKKLWSEDKYFILS